VSLGDFIRGFFAKRRNPQLDSLESFLSSHKGVEGFIEPRTATQSTTLLLVDREGVSARAAVRDPADAVAFCEKWSLPVYDASVVGYPKRMLDATSRRPPRPTHDIDEQIADLERRLREGGPG
jgi:hypothetical protein